MFFVDPMHHRTCGAEAFAANPFTGIAIQPKANCIHRFCQSQVGHLYELINLAIFWHFCNNAGGNLLHRSEHTLVAMTLALGWVVHRRPATPGRGKLRRLVNFKPSQR